MTSTIHADKIMNSSGDQDSGVDLLVNDQVKLKTANTDRVTVTDATTTVANDLAAATIKTATVKHTGGTTGLTIDSTGRILTPARPMFEVGKNAGQSVASGTITKMTWQTEAYDVGGNFASDKFTAPIAGKYFMSVYLTMQTTVAGAGIGLIWYKNGSTFKYAHHQSTEINITFGMHNATVFDLAANDYIEIYAFQGSGSTREIGQGDNVGSGTNANSNYWTGHLIG